VVSKRDDRYSFLREKAWLREQDEPAGKAIPGHACFRELI